MILETYVQLKHIFSQKKSWTAVDYKKKKDILEEHSEICLFNIELPIAFSGICGRWIKGMWVEAFVACSKALSEHFTECNTNTIELKMMPVGLPNKIWIRNLLNAKYVL
jgi:hypothetical protein